MTEQDKLIAYSLTEYVAYIRGKYINIVSHIEKQIDVNIANHYCKSEDLALEIVDFILGDKYINFEYKRQIFILISKRHNTQWYSTNKNQIDYLAEIVVHRNRLAHLLINISDEAILRFKEDKTIGFVKFGKETKPIYYTSGEIQELLDKAESLRTLLLW